MNWKAVGLGFALAILWGFTAAWMASIVTNAHMKDCQKIGKYRYGDAVIECAVVKHE